MNQIGRALKIIPAIIKLTPYHNNNKFNPFHAEIGKFHEI